MRKTRVPEVPSQIAFHASMSGNHRYSSGNTILFDHVTLDMGGGYSPKEGTYIAPKSGVYVFTWAIQISIHSFYSTQLIVDGNAHLGTDTSSQSSSDSDGTTATTVVQLNQGDRVFIRVAQSQGAIVSGVSQHTSSFSGWKLV